MSEEQTQPDITINPTTGEKIVLKSLLDFRERNDIEVMTKDQADLMLQLFGSEVAAGDKLDAFNREDFTKNRYADIIAKVSGSFGFRVFAARMHPTTQLTIETFWFILDMCKGPGDAVLWCYTLHRLSQSNGGKLITLQELATQFPFGFPTEDARHRCWRYQKGETHALKIDNLIDNSVFW